MFDLLKITQLYACLIVNNLSLARLTGSEACSPSLTFIRRQNFATLSGRVGTIVPNFFLYGNGHDLLMHFCDSNHEISQMQRQSKKSTKQQQRRVGKACLCAEGVGRATGEVKDVRENRETTYNITQK